MLFYYKVLRPLNCDATVGIEPVIPTSKVHYIWAKGVDTKGLNKKNHKHTHTKQKQKPQQKPPV